jgi:hypothetical protein
LGLKGLEIPNAADRNCAMLVMVVAKKGTPHPNAEYGMNNPSLVTLKDPLENVSNRTFVSSVYVSNI